MLEYIIPFAVPTALYVIWRIGNWLWTAALYRWTQTFSLTSDNHDQWEWLQSFIRASLEPKAKHWIPMPNSAETRTIAGNMPIPTRFEFEGRTVRMAISLVEPSRMKISWGADDGTDRRMATLWTHGIGVNGAFWQRLLQHMKKVHKQTGEEGIGVLSPTSGNGGLSAWLRPTHRTPRRPLETLTLGQELIDDILADLASFQSPAYKKYALAHGVPYRRGWLFEGPPGNGKSSMIVAIASHLSTDIALISLNSKNLDDVALRSLMEGACDKADPPRLFVLEDVDCLFDKREGNDAARVTFSGLLNALDGVAAPVNSIVIMTSNHADKLDPALVRPGRVDRRFRFDNPDDGRIAAHFMKFFPKETRFSEETLAFIEQCRAAALTEGCACSMAHVQEQILRRVNAVKAWL